MVNFKGDGERRATYHIARYFLGMYLAIPSNSTRQQMEAINKSLDYANHKGVKIIVKERLNRNEKRNFY